jgi:hypothetical protein
MQPVQKALSAARHFGMRCRYNKTQEDFDSKDEWDNYLEQMEDISEWHMCMQQRSSKQ